MSRSKKEVAVNPHHPNLRRIGGGVVAASLLLLAGCGSSSTKTAGTNPLSSAATPNTPKAASAAGANTFADPCSLLTRAEVDTATGQPLGAGKQVATLDDCQWANSDFSASVDVTVSDWTGVNNAATANGTKAPPPAATGIGDEAYYYQGLLYIRKGDAGFLLSVNWPGIYKEADYGLAKATVLAKAVVGRL